jgi:hypothetical protein
VRQPAAVTVLLKRLSSGDRCAADELIPAVYAELHVIAMQRLRREREGHTLQPTVLVNEASANRQAQDANTGHAQATGLLTAAQINEIVNFESGLYTAQAIDFGAGSLSAGAATGGPAALAAQHFYVGINDPLGQNPTGAPFTPVIFNLFSAWANPHGLGSDARAGIARGEVLFNSRVINITGVAGLNDALGQTVISGTCGTCHDSPNAGDHSNLGGSEYRGLRPIPWASAICRW